MNREWYVLWTKPRYEERVAGQLRDRGLEVFSPRIESPRTPWKANTEPLFSCYVFGRIDIGSEELLIARSFPGVRAILGMAGHPAPVPDEMVQQIRNRVERENSPSFRLDFHVGERVFIGSGPFKDLEAIFDRKLSASGRARVFIRMVGKLWSIQLESMYLRKAV